MTSNLVHRLINYLADYGAARVDIIRDAPFDMSFVIINGSIKPSLPDFVCDAIDTVNPEDVVYVGSQDYSGALPCVSYTATNLMELDRFIEDTDQKPQVLLLDFTHLREDAYRAAQIAATRMIDSDRWEEQLTVLVLPTIPLVRSPEESLVSIHR